MNLNRTALLIAGLAVSLLMLAGCGGGNGGDEGAQAPPGKAGAVSEVAMSEFKFEPSNVTAKRGSTITVRNEGSAPHDLKLRKDGKTVGGTNVFGGGKSVKLKVSFPPGEYEMFCSVPGHEESGMKGSFTVR